MRRLLLFLPVLIVLALAAGATSHRPAQAATLTVTNLTDCSTAGCGSLRAVLAASNNGDVINFQAGLTGSISPTNILGIPKDVTITGPGASVITVNFSGCGLCGFNNVLGGQTIVMSGLTITGASRSAFQFSGISLTLSDMVITGNSAPFSGGGLAFTGAIGTLVVTNSTFSNNTATPQGGGIYLAVPAGMATITGSTISGNTATTGGGGIWNSGQLTLTNSTVSGNTVTAPTFGGGNIYNNRNETLTNVTLADGKSLATGGSLSHGGSVATTTLRNTIIAQGGSGTAGNCSVSAISITSQGGNLSSDTTCNLPGTDKSSQDPLLLALANNGGPTLTNMLGAGSPAIDGGTNTGCPTTDQRGLPRPTDGDGNGTAICDIGAVELPAFVVPTLIAPAIAKSFNPPSIAPGGTSTLTITVTNPNASAITAIAWTDTLPAGLSTTGSISNTCPGAVVGIGISNGTLAANASCTMTVSVAASAGGSYHNTTSSVTSSAGTGTAANATLVVTSPSAPSTPTPPPTSTPVILVTIPGAMPTPVIPVFQNPSAGAFFNPIAKSPTPLPAVAAAAPPVTFDPNSISLRPPNTGDAGLKALDQDQ